MRQHHLGAELWVETSRSGADAIARMRNAVDALAAAAQCEAASLVPLS